MMFSEKREGKRRKDCLVKMETEMSDAATSHRMPGTLAFLEGLYFPCLLILKKKKENGKELFNFSFEKMNYFFFKIKTQGGEVEAVGSTEGYSPYSL